MSEPVKCVCARSVDGSLDPSPDCTIHLPKCRTCGETIPDADKNCADELYPEDWPAHKGRCCDCAEEFLP